MAGALQDLRVLDLSRILAGPYATQVHSDLGDGFIRAVDGRTRRIVGADHECGDSDVIKIHAKS